MYWLLPLSLLPALVAAIPNPEPVPQTHHIPLRRRSSQLQDADGMVDIDRLVRAKDALMRKYGYAPTTAPQRRQSQTDIAIGNQVRAS